MFIKQKPKRKGEDDSLVGKQHSTRPLAKNLEVHKAGKIFKHLQDLHQRVSAFQNVSTSMNNAALIAIENAVYG